MVIFPGCKINIGLNITEKRKDGFHNLESIFYPINLTDILEIVKSDSFEFSFSGIPIDGDVAHNLVYKAYLLLQKQYALANVKIHLHKVVPMGAGLGGGSADAAATLLVLNELFELNIDQKTLEQMADSLGSDCAFFIQNKVAYVQGKGEVLSEHPLSLTNYYLKIVNPGIHINTKTAFENISTTSKGSQLEKLNENEINTWQGKVLNQFEQTIFPHYPEIKEIKDKLLREGAIYSAMTGTGSSVYGIFKNKPTHSFESYFEWITQL